MSLLVTEVTGLLLGYVGVSVLLKGLVDREGKQGCAYRQPGALGIKVGRAAARLLKGGVGCRMLSKEASSKQGRGVRLHLGWLSKGSKWLAFRFWTAQLSLTRDLSLLVANSACG